MSNLLGALRMAGGSLEALQTALAISQNNISNVSTPGYAKQRANLQALPFEPDAGLTGGVTSADLLDARDQFAESAVRREVSAEGYATQLSTSLGTLSGAFDVSADKGVPGALTALWQAASAWSTSPDSTTARTQFLRAAGNVATSFREAAGVIGRFGAQIDGEIQSSVDRINTLGSTIAAINAQKLRSAAPDAGLDAQLNTALEDLSKLADINTLRASDGSVTVLLGGQVPLVLGGVANSIRTGSAPAPGSTNPNAPQQTVLTDGNGNDAGRVISGGSLAALLETRNRILPSILGDGTQIGDLNQLAKSVADRVNALLTAGQTQGSAAAPGVPIFTYGTTFDTGVAASLAVDPNVQAGQLAVVQTGPPRVGNGVPLAIAGLAASTDPADQVGGSTFAEFYGRIGAGVGDRKSQADTAATRQSALVAQAHSLRDRLSGVSLDEEALLVMQFQKGYQALAQFTNIIGQLTDSLLSMVR